MMNSSFKVHSRLAPVWRQQVHATCPHARVQSSENRGGRKAQGQQKRGVGSGVFDCVNVSVRKRVRLAPALPEANVGPETQR